MQTNYTLPGLPGRSLRLARFRRIARQPAGGKFAPTRAGRASLALECRRAVQAQASEDLIWIALALCSLSLLVLSFA